MASFFRVTFLSFAFLVVFVINVDSASAYVAIDPSVTQLDFGSVQIGQSKTMSFTVQAYASMSSDPRTLSGSVVGTDATFTCIAGCNYSNLPVNTGSHTITIRFTPGWTQLYSGGAGFSVSGMSYSNRGVSFSGTGFSAPSCGPAARNYYSFEPSYSSGGAACTGGYQDWYLNRTGSNYQPSPWTFPNYGSSSSWNCPNVDRSSGPTCTATRNNYPRGSVTGGSCTIPRFSSSCTVNVSWSSSGAEQGRVYLMKLSPSIQVLSEGLSGSYALGLYGETNGQVSAFDVVVAPSIQTPPMIGRQMANSSGSGYNSARVSSQCESGTVWVGTGCDVPPPAAPPAPVVDLKINGSNGPVSILYGSNFTLSWGNVANATSCTGASTAQTSWAGAKAIAGGNDTGMRALTSGSYTITCDGPGGSTSDRVNISVVPLPAPVVDLKINGSDGPLETTNGSSLNITWPAIANAVSCVGDSGTNWSGPGKSIFGGNDTAVASGASVYTLTCTNAQGVTGTDSVSVTIKPTLKMCQDSCDSGIEPPSSFGLNRGDIKNLVACYNDAASCTVNTGDLTGDPSCTWAVGGNNFISLSGSAPKTLKGDNIGTESVQVSCNTDSVTKDVTVSCTDSGACARDGQYKNLCQKDTFTVTDNCGQTQTCHGEKTCDYNWIEVAP